MKVSAKTVVFTQLTRYGGQNDARGDEKFVSLSTDEDMNSQVKKQIEYLKSKK